MFVFLGALAASKTPIVLLPGLYASALTATYEKGYSKHWYCPQTQSNDLFWINLKYVIPPTYNCLFEMLKGYYDETTGKVTSPPGLKVDVPDFGGEEGIAYVDAKGIFGLHFVESFHSMLEFLKSKDYTVKKDLFGAPYDWRLAMSGIEESFFPKLKDLIEHAYNINGGSKVAVLGYSCGGICIQRFFANYVDAKWKDTYIAKAIFLAPAFAGSPMTVDVAWNRYFPVLPFLKSDIIQDAAETIPCVHSLFPNPNIYLDKPIITGPDGDVLAKDIPDFLVKKGKFHENNIKLMRKDAEIIKDIPKNPGVDLMMLYNSAVPTAMTFNFVNGYDEDPEIINEKGDGTVPSIGPEWACNNWNINGTALVCYDINQSDEDYNHAGMSTNVAVLEIIYKYVSTEEWTKTKTARFVIAPKIKLFNNKTDYSFEGKEEVIPVKIH